jgi:hypothetical protein
MKKIKMKLYGDPQHGKVDFDPNPKIFSDPKAIIIDSLTELYNSDHKNDRRGDNNERTNFRL